MVVVLPPLHYASQTDSHADPTRSPLGDPPDPVIFRIDVPGVQESRCRAGTAPHTGCSMCGTPHSRIAPCRNVDNCKSPESSEIPLPGITPRLRSRCLSNSVPLSRPLRCRSYASGRFTPLVFVISQVRSLRPRVLLGNELPSCSKTLCLPCVLATPDTAWRSLPFSMVVDYLDILSR